MLLLVVGNEALEVADAERFDLFAKQTCAFAVIFLRADASGNRRKHIVFANFRGCAEVVAVDDQLHKILDLPAHRAIARAAWLGALETAQRFLMREFSRVSEINFCE